MPSPASRLWRRIAVAAVLLGASLSIFPPVLGRAAPETVVDTRTLGPAALTPAAAPARLGGAAPTKRAIWTRTTRVCAPFRFTMVALVWKQAGDRHVTAELSWGTGSAPGHATVEADPHDAPDAGSREDTGIQGTPPVWTGEQRCASFRLRLPIKDSLRALRAVFINSSGTASEPSALQALGDRVVGAWGAIAGVWAAAPAQAATAQPGIISRAEWGANESLRNCGPFYADALRMSYIHHTATGNDYGPDRADDVIRGIYAYHTKARGWCDIAYQFLVDRFGRIYEGRYGGIDQPIIGAHAMGFNTGSAGIAAIGNYVVAHPSVVVVRAIKRLVSWRMDVAHVSPTGWTTMTSAGGPNQKYKKGETVLIRTVVAHRRTGYTVCPGHLWELMGKIRRDAALMGLPKIYDVSQSATGLVHGLSTVQYRGTISEPLRWQVSITDQYGQVVQAFSGHGTAIDAVWNGLDQAANPVSDGIYDVTISAGGGATDPSATPAAFKLTVCATPPPPAAVPAPGGSPTPAPAPTASPGPCG
jgi:N-acetylmuramoyl-L-alanine amidase-like protein